MAVWFRASNVLSPNRARRSSFVFNHNGLAEQFTQFLLKHTDLTITGSARGVRDNDGDGAIRKILRRNCSHREKGKGY
jgi:hypothetical protein